MGANTHTAKLLYKMKVLGTIGVVCFLSCLLHQASSQELPEGKNVGKLFGGYSTRTRLSTLTSTILYTCASTVAQGTTCSGRKKRAVRTIEDIKSLEGRSLDASSDNSGDLLEGPQQIESSDRDSSADDVGKLFIALTTFTTITTTSFTVNMSTTVSVSYVCLPLGGTVPAAC